jgi:hypothetical protein
MSFKFCTVTLKKKRRDTGAVVIGLFDRERLARAHAEAWNQTNPEADRTADVLPFPLDHRKLKQQR